MKLPRLLREDEYQRLLAMIATCQEEIAALISVGDVLRERLIEAAGDLGAARTMRDMLITRVNVLETEVATLRQKQTGIPQIAPQIERGAALDASAAGAGLDLFADVGDERALELRDRGLIHEDRPRNDESDDVAWPSAAELTAFADPSGRPE